MGVQLQRWLDYLRLWLGEKVFIVWPAKSHAQLH